MDPMRKVLHVGCGPATLKDLPSVFQDGSWTEIRLDIDPDISPDVVGTVTDMSAIETGSIQAVFSSHNIEHLFPHEVSVALAEFRRVLDDDGFALVTCPDLQTVARFIAEDGLLDPVYMSSMGPITPLDILYGHRASIASGNHFMAHRGGFTMRTLTQALIDAGFAQVVTNRRPANFDLWTLGLVSSLMDEEQSRRATELLPI